MKTFISAFALLVAAPVAAQSTAAAPVSPAAAHAQHQGMDHSQHGGMDHSKMDHSKMDHSQHKGDCCQSQDHKGCCEKAAAGAKTMACCQPKSVKPAQAPAADADGHSGHDH